jgi:hypothetical protein
MAYERGDYVKVEVSGRSRNAPACTSFIGFSLGRYSVLAVLLGLRGDEAFLIRCY